MRFAPSNFGDPTPRTASADLASSTPGGDALGLNQTPLQGTVPPPDINVAIADSGDFGDVCATEQADLNLTLFNQGGEEFAVEYTVAPIRDHSGGVLGALGKRAEGIYTGLDRAGQDTARQVFLRLVTLVEMRPVRRTAVHTSDDLAELEELLEGDELSELEDELSNDDAV